MASSPERDTPSAATPSVIGIILAAGRGTRMRSRRPKVLHPVGGVPLVGHLLRVLRATGVRRTVVVTGHGAERVEKCCSTEAGDDVALTLVRQEPPRGTGDAVRLAVAGLAGESGTLLIVNGDLPLLSEETLGALLVHYQSERAAMTILSIVRDDPTGYGRLERDRSGAVLRVIEERDATPEERTIREVNGGIYAVELSALGPALESWCVAEEERIAGGGVGPDEIYFPPVIAPIAAAGGKVVDWALPPEKNAELQQVNDRLELSAVADRLRHRIIADHQRAGVTVVDPGQTWIECDVEIGEDTTIHPGCVIRRGVRIGAACEVGPFAHLREGTILEDDVHIGNFVEVKKTRVGRGTRAKHLTYLGNGEIGAGVNIGAGTVLANYDGRRKSTTRIEDGAFIGSGTIIVAPAEIGPGAQTGAGAVVTRGQKVPPGETVIGVPARPLRKKSPADPEPLPAATDPVDAGRGAPEWRPGQIAGTE